MATPVVLKALLDLSDGVTFNETSADCYDISDIVITANTRRGRSRQLDKIEAGYAVITVIDENGDFNPDNTASPYYGKLKPGNKIRLYPDYDDGTGSFRYPDIFTGYVFNYKINFSMGVNQANQITIEAYDAFKIFNSVSITDVTNSTTGDSSDERIGQILDLQQINWPAALRTFETSALSLADDQGDLRTVLDAIRQVEDTEVGLVFVDGSGEVQFKNRTTANSQPDYNDAYKFSDNGIETSYNDLRLTQNDDILINRVTVKSFNNSTEVTVYDTTSETTYFTRSAERANVLLTSTTDLTGVANQLLANYKDSSLQIDRIVLNLSEYEQIDRVIAGLYFDIFFIPLYIEKTLSGNTTINRLGWIQGVNHDITPNSWLVTAFTGITNPYEVIPNWLTSLYLTSNGSFSLNSANVAIGHHWAAFDSSNNIFIKALSKPTLGAAENAIIKLSQNGTVNYKVKLTSSFALDDDSVISPDGSGGIYFGGASDNKLYLARLNSDLTANWQKIVSNADAYYPARIMKDSTNNVYAVWNNYGVDTYTAIAKYSNAGTSLVEAKIYGTDPANAPELYAAEMAEDYIYVLNYLPDDATYGRFELLKLNTSAEIVSQVGIIVDGEWGGETWNIAVDSNDNKYVVSDTFWGTGINYQVTKLNASNQIEWDKRYYDNVTTSNAKPMRTVFDSTGHLVMLVGGYPTGAGVEELATVVRMNTAGTIVEQYSLRNSKQDLYSHSIDIDTTGRIVIPATYKASNYDTATVISLKPEFETLGTYTFLTGSDFTYGTWGWTYGTDGETYTTTGILSATTDTYTETSMSLTITTVTSEVTTIEFT
ncbi:MAG: hypothetical protein ACO3CN_00425 [Candidatus Nanopelagicales bacterium]